MKAFRLFLFFVVGLALGGTVSLSYAQTPINPTGWGSHVGNVGTTLSAAVQAEMTFMQNNGQSGCSINGQGWNWGNRQGYAIGYQCSTGGGFAASINWSCPAGTSQVQGSTPACACPSGLEWNAQTNTCQQPQNNCQAGETVDAPYFGGWRVGKAPNALVGADGGNYNVPPPSTVCDGSCTISVSTSGTCTSDPAAYVDTPQPVNCVGTGTKTGGSCSTNSATPPGPPPNIPQKKPPCGADEGVLTSSSGTVKCVPPGTPGNTPKVEKSKKTESFNDGSQKITESTKTTDPVTGATNSSDKVTNTPNSSGAPGAAGTPGTTEGSTDTSKNTTGETPADEKSEDDADCDPAKDFCGSPGVDGLYEKKSKSFSDVFGTFSNGIKGTPAGSAMTGFFNVSAHAAGCPNWVVTVPYWNVTLSGADYFCNSTATLAMQGVGLVLLAIVSIIGFRWAFL